MDKNEHTLGRKTRKLRTIKLLGIQTMVDSNSINTTFKIGKKVADTLYEVYRNNQKQKIERFLSLIDLRVDSLCPDELRRFNAYIDTYSGKLLLAKFVEAIVKTSAERANMAIALIYCKDPEIDMSETDTEAFVTAVTGISDDSIDMFLLCLDQQEIDGVFPYTKMQISERSFINEKFSPESVFILVNNLINRGLLLPEPRTSETYLTSGDDWCINYGITETTHKFASLLRKAEHFLGNFDA